MKSKLLSDDVFMVDVRAMTGAREDAQKYLEKIESDFEISENALGICIRVPDGSLLLWLHDPSDFYVLLHETTHLVRMVLVDCGVDVDLKYGDEVFAYYQMYWFRKLWRYYSSLMPKGGENSD